MRPKSTRTVATRRAPHRRYVPVAAPPAPWPGLYPGEPATCRRDLRRFWPVMLHLGLLLAVVHVYRIEGGALRLVVTTELAALPVH